MLVDNGLHCFRFLKLWTYDMRIERCAIPNRATLLVWRGEGDLFCGTFTQGRCWRKATSAPTPGHYLSPRWGKSVSAFVRLRRRVLESPHPGPLPSAERVKRSRGSCGSRFSFASPRLGVLASDARAARTSVVNSAALWLFI